ncbi:hypothetical protein MY11210_002001 [Beauveria gryllotalpidicola]
MDGLTREIKEGSKIDQIINAFESALAGKSGPERCIELLRPDPSTDSESDVDQIFAAMHRDAERDAIAGVNAEGRVPRSEALCQTAVLLAMCSGRSFEAREKLVREIVAHHQRSENEKKNQQQSNKHEGDAEHWRGRAKFNLVYCKSRASRFQTSNASEIEECLKTRKEFSEMIAKMEKEKE